MSIDMNCDMGESFGLYSFGNDAAIMPHITQANVACGFHGSDPNHMERTVALAKEYGVKVGAHVSLPDLQGFGRREMKIERDELRNIILYQVGALTAFLKKARTDLSHIKPHGALYGMATREEHIAEAVVLRRYTGLRSWGCLVHCMRRFTRAVESASWLNSLLISNILTKAR